MCISDKSSLAMLILCLAREPMLFSTGLEIPIWLIVELIRVFGFSQLFLASRYFAIGFFNIDIFFGRILLRFVGEIYCLGSIMSLIHISEPTRPDELLLAGL